ncbi:hypothetical protein L1987_82683 [Smallanthus sonchifolius]|uniref:Uncharacterized protein n=1 Tax=Smallanthus sonchifolius TaxID=185202 RepID=A0ACB8YC44_9ASTR|nr:hypothetical protein L1987_82683 [Smallanthus sonchifolius]
MEENQTASDRNINRNIVDMLRDDQASGSKKNWKAFRDKLRLKRTGKAWTSSVPIPASDVPIQGKSNRMMTRRGSWRYAGDSDADAGESDGDATQLGHMPERQRSGRLLPVETDPEEDGNNPPDGEQKPAAGEGDQIMSLMTLLSTDGSNYVEEEEEHVEDHHEEPEEDEEEGTGDCHVCCGCRGKHKGAALGPCGHTFCKHCTKELHVSKGNCPTCNDFILEILDMF